MCSLSNACWTNSECNWHHQDGRWQPKTERLPHSTLLESLSGFSIYYYGSVFCKGSWKPMTDGDQILDRQVGKSLVGDVADSCSTLNYTTRPQDESLFFDLLKRSASQVLEISARTHWWPFKLDACPQWMPYVGWRSHFCVRWSTLIVNSSSCRNPGSMF